MKNLFERLVNWLIKTATKTPYTNISDYMHRYWLVPYKDDKSFPGQFPLLGRILGWLGIAIRVHHILRSDDDRAFHDHPWGFITVILRGQYTEVRPVYNGDGLYIGDHRKTYGPGSVLRRKPTDWHRLELAEGETVWTLFITGPWQQNWGFLASPSYKVFHADYPAAEPKPLVITGKCKVSVDAKQLWQSLEDAKRRIMANEEASRGIEKAPGPPPAVSQFLTTKHTSFTLTGEIEDLFTRHIEDREHWPDLATFKRCLHDIASRHPIDYFAVRDQYKQFIASQGYEMGVEDGRVVLLAKYVEPYTEPKPTPQPTTAPERIYTTSSSLQFDVKPRIIGLVGSRCVGKDTVADYLVRCHGFTKLAYADALREEVLAAFPEASQFMLTDRNLKETPAYRLRLSSCKNQAFIQAVLLSENATEGTESAYDFFDQPRSPRWILQRWGTEYRRQQDPYYWVKRMAEKLDKLIKETPDAQVVISDVRFADEARLVIERSPRQRCIWHITRPGCDVVDHTSDDYKWLAELRRARVEPVRNNANRVDLYQLVDGFVTSSLGKV